MRHKSHFKLRSVATVFAVAIFVLGCQDKYERVGDEAVDPVYQKDFLEKLEQTGRRENVVGWYHSHPGFGCWLSGVDVNTAMSFERLNERSVSVVIDPIQSVKGKIVIDAFRTIPKQVAADLPGDQAAWMCETEIVLFLRCE